MVAKIRIDIPAATRVMNRASLEFLEVVAQEMLREARAIARTGEYATGELAASLEIQGPAIRGTQARAAVGTYKSYALAVHDGAKIHNIFPKSAPHIYRFGSRKKPQLRFFWRKAGKVVFLPHIPGSAGRVGSSHPGIRRGKHFLSIPLVEVSARHGLRVTLRNV